jgi:hypothetical protein
MRDFSEYQLPPTERLIFRAIVGYFVAFGFVALLVLS